MAKITRDRAQSDQNLEAGSGGGATAPGGARRDRRAQVAVTFTDEDGTTRRYYFRGRTKREARQKAEAARQRVASGAPVRDADRLITGWWRSGA